MILTYKYCQKLSSYINIYVLQVYSGGRNEGGIKLVRCAKQQHSWSESRINEEGIKSSIFWLPKIIGNGNKAILAVYILEK